MWVSNTTIRIRTGSTSVAKISLKFNNGLMSIIALLSLIKVLELGSSSLFVRRAHASIAGAILEKPCREIRGESPRSWKERERAFSWSS